MLLAVFEAHRRAGGRFGGGVIAVPAPEGAVLGHQTLALEEQRLQTPAGFHVFNDTDLAQAPVQRVRSLDVQRQRLGANGKRRRIILAGNAMPVDRRRLVGGRRQIVAKCRAQGCLQAGIDVDGIDHRRP